MMTMTKLEIAEHQLRRAVLLFLDGDYVCAITLAGAAEEILGRLLEESGEQHALGNYVSLCLQGSRGILPDKDLKAIYVGNANEFRNGLKHWRDGTAMTIPLEAAVAMLDRAIENYRKLDGKNIPEIDQYQLATQDMY